MRGVWRVVDERMNDCLFNERRIAYKVRTAKPLLRCLSARSDAQELILLSSPLCQLARDEWPRPLPAYSNL